MAMKKPCHPIFMTVVFVTFLDLIDAIKGMLTEIAEEGRLTERVLKHNTGFILGILSLGK
jgi:hypothetical protein